MYRYIYCTHKTLTSHTDAKIVKEKPNLAVKIVDKGEKSILVKTEEPKADKNGLKSETTTTSTATATKLLAAATATKRLLPPIHTSMIKKTSAIDKAAITKDIAAIINGSSSGATATATTTANATITATTTATATAIPTATANTSTTTAVATTTTTTTNNDSNSNSNITTNVSTSKISTAEGSAEIIEGSTDKPEEEEPAAEKEEKPVEEGPAKKRKRRSHPTATYTYIAIVTNHHELIKMSVSLFYSYSLQKQVADSIGPRKTRADSAREGSSAVGRGGEGEGGRQGEGSAAAAAAADDDDDDGR